MVIHRLTFLRAGNGPHQVAVLPSVRVVLDSALTRTPRGPNSAAYALVGRRSVVLLALYSEERRAEAAVS